MNKTELIDAIQQVITPNGQKGITAESLANLLIEMVNATPEGGSGGSGQVVFYAGMPTEEVNEITGLTKMSLTPEQKQHNAEMFTLVKNANPASPYALDLSDAYCAEMGVSGIKYNCLSFYALFMPKDAAIITIGIDQDIITGLADPPHFIYADGSVELDFS